MKKLAFIIVAVLIANTGSAYAQENNSLSYVVTDDGAFFFEHLRYGFKHYLVATNDKGEKQYFKKSDVRAYKKNGHVFELKTIDSKENAEFLELVSYRNGVKLYREFPKSEFNAEFMKAYLFKDDRLILNVNQHNLNYVLNFFNTGHQN